MEGNVEGRLKNLEGNIAKLMSLINYSSTLHVAQARVLTEHNVRITAIEAYVERQQGGLK